MNIVAKESPAQGARQKLESEAARFAGDSRDDMQLTSGQFTMVTALDNNKFATFDDSPAAVRAPTGIQNAH